MIRRTQEREGSEYGTPEAQVRPSPSASPSLAVSAGPAQAEATFHPVVNLAETLASAEGEVAQPAPALQAAAESQPEEPVSRPTAVVPALDEGPVRFDQAHPACHGHKADCIITHIVHAQPFARFALPQTHRPCQLSTRTFVTRASSNRSAGNRLHGHTFSEHAVP